MATQTTSSSSSQSLKAAVWTVLTLVVFCGLTFAYMRVTEPLFTADHSHDIQFTHPETEELVPQPPENRMWAEKHLPNQPWAMEAKYQLRNRDTVLYTNTWDPVDRDHAIRIRPFAMIFQADEDGRQQQPITVSGDSAYLRFEGSIDLESPSPGRIQFGALEGEVTIEGPEGLKITGRNFAFDENSQKIWSDELVAFQYGPHQGRGRGVEIELYAMGPKKAFGTVAVTGAKLFRIRRDVQLKMEVDSSNSNMGLPGSEIANKGNEDENETPLPLLISSHGPFQFDLEQNRGKFSDRVHVERALPDGPADTLDCDELLVELQPKDDEARAQAAERRARMQSTVPGEFVTEPLDPGLMPHTITAKGKPAIVSSPSNQLKIHADEARYGFTDHQIRFQSADRVRVLREQTLLESKQVLLQMSAEGSPQYLQCDGTGTMKHVDVEQGKLMFEAGWESQLHATLNAPDGRQLIRLKEKAVVRQPYEKMGLSADEIEFWMAGDATPQPNDKEEAEGKSKFDVMPSNIQPEEIIARGTVVMVSPQLLAETKELRVNFVKPLEKVAETALLSPQESRQQLILTSQHVPAFASIPPEQLPEGAGTAKPVPTDPLKLVADKIRVLVDRQEMKSKPTLSATEMSSEDQQEALNQIREIITEGNVRIRQDRPDGQPPLTASGDRIVVANEGEGNKQLLKMFGSPAHIRDQGAHIQASQIFVDRMANRAWVEGEGLLELPVNQTPDGKKLAEPTRLDVWWTKKMDFDGQVVKFTGEVRTILAADRLLCKEMQVKLSKPISFAEAGSDFTAPRGPSVASVATPQTGDKKDSSAPPAELQEVYCTGGVEVDGYEYIEGVLKSIRRARFWEFRVDTITGETIASGPGWVMLWRRGERDRAKLANEAVVRANSTIEQDEAQWEFTRVDFHRDMNGNIHDRISKFDHGVEILYGPVLDERTKIDPESLPDEGVRMECSNLRLTQHPEEGEQKAYVEFLAGGNVELEGRSFFAQADTISFDESKGLYMLRSLGERKATIWRQASAGSQSSRADARRMEFIPSKSILKLDQASGLDGVR
ncbi:LptA/OstA family protein [Calycomorphotria hydatis]|uniref:OstA-like protein n=1 Tax=Calycomorphotria hydatis TaxID=2528027 RepID=A0A517T6X4_9PLAN|nr:hypothetical protein [Calycomorphotria hydatis]QDT64121.1 OstA-like protein [Calycomorphotria hydatis]